jgi:acetyl esterase/lipase
MEGIGATMASKAADDPIVDKARLVEIAKLYLGGADPRTPLAAPIYADLRGLAPLFIQVGAAETLLDDALRLAGAAGAADVRVGLEIWPEMIHVWHLFHPALAADRRAITEGGAFIRALSADAARFLDAGNTEGSRHAQLTGVQKPAQLTWAPFVFYRAE